MRRRHVHVPKCSGIALVNAQTLLNEFDLIAEAPSGVAKLRQLILQLAVRGKLVQQDPKDGVAGTGLKELRFPENEPYPIPENWRWTTLRSVSKELGQKVPDAPFTYIDVSAIDSERGMVGEQVQILGPSNAPSRARKLVDFGTVIYSTVRPYLLNIAVVDREFDPAPIVSTAFFVMCPVKCVASRFLFHYLRSDSFTAYVQGAMTGMAYPAINDAKMSVAPFPLPPLAEQKRIVARVDELMKRCDDLEERQKDRNERRTALTASCLNAVTSAPRKTAASEIRRVLDSFPLLIDTPESVAELRKTILQLAAQGRLVPQHATDTSVGVLIKTIEEEMSRLASAKHSRTTQTQYSLGSFKKPYELPLKWEWAQLGSISLIERGGSPRPIKSYLTDKPDGLNWIKIGDTEKGGKYITATREKIRKDGLTKTRMVYPGDFLLTNSMSYGRPYITKIEGCIHDGWLRIHPPKSLEKDYLYYLLSSSYVTKFFKGAAAGAVVPNLNADKVRELPIPLPPLAEQKRIAAKVNKLMALCDALEVKLAQSRDDADILTAAVVHHICSGGARRVVATL